MHSRQTVTSSMSIATPPPQDPDWLKPFLGHCHRRRYPSKTDFIHPGDPSDTIYYLVSGQVTVLIEDEDGREIILTYLNKGEFIGEMGMFLPQPKRTVMVRTRTACEPPSRSPIWKLGSASSPSPLAICSSTPAIAM